MAKNTVARSADTGKSGYRTSKTGAASAAKKSSYVARLSDEKRAERRNRAALSSFEAAYKSHNKKG